MNSTFAPHGKFSLSVKENIIYIEAQGPWNIEFTLHLHQDLLAVASQVDINNYGIVLTPIGEAIAGDDVIQAHINFVSNAQTKAVAVNFEKCLTIPISQALFKRVYESAGINYQFFSSMANSKKWVKTQLS